MKKIINTFKYGSLRTRGMLIMTILAGLTAVGFAVCAIVSGQLMFFFGAVIAAFIAVSLAQTFGIYAVDEPFNAGLVQDENRIDNNHDLTPRHEVRKHEKKRKEKTDTEGKPLKDKEAQAEEKVLKEEEAPVREKKLKKRKNHTSADDLKKEISANSDEAGRKEPAPATEEEMSSYDRRKLRKTLHKYRVKSDHRMVLIDHCEKLSIFQTAAYIWVDGKEFHILLIEHEPRHLLFPVFSLKEITYLKRQPANVDVDYAAFKGRSMLAELFRPYLPDYSHSTVVDDLTAYKNLYGVGPGIYFTNRSAANLFDILGLDFHVEDKVTCSNKVNTFFKDTYKANIMLRDNVFDANCYADRISNILDDMARSAISYNEFKDTLNLMVKNKLITQEFAMYYMEVRDKVSR